MRIGTNTHALSHVLPYGIQGMDIQSIRDIDDSGSTLLSENGDMMTNMTGSGILKSTGHTDQVKPGNLSVRFILEGEQHSENLSDSEQSEGISDSEDGNHVYVQ